MDYRLGLDLGTNSLGWSIYSLDENKEVQNLENLGVRIFSDGRNPKTNEPLAVERRTARGQRRMIYRRKLRRNGAFRLLQKEGLFPKTREEAEPLKLLNPYELRVKALDEKLEPYELGRALFNLSVRRGFKSNRKDNSNETEKESSSDKLTQKDMCIKLNNVIKTSGARTLAEYLVKHQDENGGLRFVPGRMTYYPTRQLYIDEFNAIREKQEPFYKTIDWDGIYNQIFYQRPLRPQERGKCLYMKDKERTFKALPCAQKIRYLQDVYNLALYDKGRTVELPQEWREILIELLDTKEKVTFAQMKKKLQLDDNVFFNLESESRPYIKGNETAVKLRKPIYFGSLWDTLSLKEQDNIVELLITANEDEEVQELLNKYDLPNENKEAIVKLTLVSGTTSFCKEFTEKVVEEMCSSKCQISKAIENLGYSYADQKVDKYDTLPYYGQVLTGSTMGIKANPRNDEEKYGKISNPTVHIALNQTRTVVNALIKKYGKPTQIVVELSRDLKASREAKINIIKKQNENRKNNEIANKNISDAFGIEYPNRLDRTKYQLWSELGEDTKVRRCIYCGKIIGGSELFTKNIEIEHILPFGRTLCDSIHNKTLSHASCNAFKGDRSPFEAFGTNPKGYNWNEILERASHLKDPIKKSYFTEKAMDKFEKESSFISRQLTDNAYLSKVALKYLKAVCDDVWSVNGGMTKLLRDKWDIDSILKRKITDKEIAYFGLTDELIGTYKKNRYDHRHHALDACVIALIDRSTVQQISRLNQHHLKNKIEVPQMPVLRKDLIDKTKNIVVSFKPDHGVNGKLSKETNLGKIKQAELTSINDIKDEKDIALIKDNSVRTEFAKCYEETKNIKQVQKSLKNKYPSLWMFKEYYVARTAVTSLKEKDISSIVDPKIREKINNFVAKHKGQKFEDIMKAFSETLWTGKTGKKYKILKVRCKNTVQKPIAINSGKVPRYVAPEDYLCAIVWEIPPSKKDGKSKFVGTFYRRDQVDEKGNPKIIEPPHSAAQKSYNNTYFQK